MTYSMSLTRNEENRAISKTMVLTLLLASAFTVPKSVSAQEMRQKTSSNHTIRFDVSIPQAPSELALFKLAPAAPPTGVVSQALSSQGNGAKLAPISSLALFA